MVEDLDYMPGFDEINDNLALSQRDDDEKASFESEKRPLKAAASKVKHFIWSDYKWSKSVQSVSDIKLQSQLIQGIVEKGSIRRGYILRVFIPRGMEIRTKISNSLHYEESLVQVELLGPGEQHRNPWATNALPNEPARR